MQQILMRVGEEFRRSARAKRVRPQPAGVTGGVSACRSAPVLGIALTAAVRRVMRQRAGARRFQAASPIGLEQGRHALRSTQPLQDVVSAISNECKATPKLQRHRQTIA